MKVIESIWFHCQMDTIGIVIAENSIGERRAFVGACQGLNLEEDMEKVLSNETRKILLIKPNEARISNWGSKITPKILRELADRIEGNPS